MLYWDHGNLGCGLLCNFRSIGWEDQRAFVWLPDESVTEGIPDFFISSS